MAHTISHAHARRRSLYRDDRADAADRRDFRRGGFLLAEDMVGLCSHDEAIGLLLDCEAADWGDLFADEDGYFDGVYVDTDAYYGDDRDRAEDDLHAEALLMLAAHNAAEDRAERIGDLDFDAICGWSAPTALVWSDWADNSVYQEV